MVLPEMQGIAGIMLGDTTSSNSSGQYHTFYGNPPPMAHPYAYSPSTERAVEREGMRRALDRQAERIKNLERREKMRKTIGIKKALPDHTVVYKAKKMMMTVGEKADRMRVQWDGEPLEGPPVGIIESGLPKPDEFTQLYNHDFHKLLANFDALLDN